MNAFTAPSESRCTMGLDIGGTKMVGCVLTPQNDILKTNTIPTRADRGGPAVADDALTLVRSLEIQAQEHQLNPCALGISVCELVTNEGIIASDATLKWRSSDILSRFNQLYPTVVEADSRAAALAECRLGVGRGLATFLYVTVGTGVGSALVVEGKLYRGARGCTGTLASGTRATLCGECGSISHSCLEAIASGTAIGQRYQAATGRKLEHPRAAYVALDAAQSGDPVALRIVTEAAVCLASTISLLIDVLDPEAVIVGGGLGTAPGIYWDTLVNTTRNHIWSELQRDVPILQSKMGMHSAAIGAAILAREKDFHDASPPR